MKEFKEELNNNEKDENIQSEITVNAENNIMENKKEQMNDFCGTCNKACCFCEQIPEKYKKARVQEKQKEKMKFGTKIIICTLIVFVTFLFVRFGIFYDSAKINKSPQPTDSKPTFEIVELEEDVEGISTRDIVKENIDSVVMLSIYKTSPDSTDGFLQNNTDAQEVKISCATGIIMSSDGYIITNRHCIIDENTNVPYSKIEITLNDGTIYESVKIIGADASTDLAVIKIDASNLQVSTFGDPSNLQLGDRVVAIGNSGGLGLSVTQGIVSGLARNVYKDTGYAIKCLQIDAAINPGNSGGPLFNAAGQIVAINSAKIVAEEYEGLGFAIPIDEAKKIIDELINYGYVRGRVSLGITGYAYKDAYYQGFLIKSINSDSSLQNTKARSGDLITKIDGVAIENYSQLRSVLSEHEIGDRVVLTLARSVNREVETFTVVATLKEEK